MAGGLQDARTAPSRPRVYLSIYRYLSMGPWDHGTVGRRRTGGGGFTLRTDLRIGLKALEHRVAREVGPNPPLGARRRREVEKWRACVYRRVGGSDHSFDRRWPGQ